MEDVSHSRVKCNKCKSLNDKSLNFCQNCGAPLKTQYQDKSVLRFLYLGVVLLILTIFLPIVYIVGKGSHDYIIWSWLFIFVIYRGEKKTAAKFFGPYIEVIVLLYLYFPIC